MEPQTPTTFSRPPPPAIPTDPVPRPQPALGLERSPSITRPYRLSPSAPNGPAARPSALLQRRSNAAQGLSEVRASPAESDPPPPPPPPPLPAPTSNLPSAYEFLNIFPSATQQEIREAYRRLAIQHHPDKAPSDRKEASAILFRQIQSAYDILKDPETRVRYDRQLSLQSSQGLPVTPRSSYCAPSPSVFTPGRGFTATYSATPRSQVYPPNVATGANPSSNGVTPRTPFSAGRSWETDQCW